MQVDGGFRRDQAARESRRSQEPSSVSHRPLLLGQGLGVGARVCALQRLIRSAASTAGIDGRRSARRPTAPSSAGRRPRRSLPWRLRAASRVAITRFHSAASSGAQRPSAACRRRHRGDPPPSRYVHSAAAARRCPRADMPPAIARASSPAPQKVSKRLAPLIAPPVSCATHSPVASVRSIDRNTGAPSGTNAGSTAALAQPGHRQPHRAERPRARSIPGRTRSSCSRA